MKSWRAVDSNFLFAENVKSDHIRYIFNVSIEDADNFEDASSVYVQYIVDLSSGITAPKYSECAISNNSISFLT